MALTKDFKSTIKARLEKDPAFAVALLKEAMEAFMAGDTQTGKLLLHDLINAAIGFEQLAAEVHKPSKSLHRMLGPKGNPSTSNLFSVVYTVQKRIGVTLTVNAKRKSTKLHKHVY